jgi:hypothetical protein
MSMTFPAAGLDDWRSACMILRKISTRQEPFPASDVITFWIGYAKVIVSHLLIQLMRKKCFLLRTDGFRLDLYWLRMKYHDHGS